MCLPRNDEQIEKNMLNTGNNKKCPYCAEIIKAEASTCRFCGKDLVNRTTGSAKVGDMGRFTMPASIRNAPSKSSGPYKGDGERRTGVLETCPYRKSNRY